jgi:hypothetical protein
MVLNSERLIGEDAAATTWALPRQTKTLKTRGTDLSSTEAEIHPLPWPEGQKRGWTSAVTGGGWEP